MGDEEVNEQLPPSNDRPDTMSALEREVFADAIRDEWDQAAK